MACSKQVVASCESEPRLNDQIAGNCTVPTESHDSLRESCMRFSVLGIVRVLTFTISFLYLCPVPMSAINITFTRLGTCVDPPGCSLTIDDNSALDANPATGIIDFSVPAVGILPGGLFSATGRAIEEITKDGSGRVTAIKMTLTDTTVRASAGGIGAPPAVPGAISLVSAEPLTSLGGVSGWASLGGQYENAAGGLIGSDILTLQARLGGLLLGNVTGGLVTNVPSPFPFSDFDSRSWPFPVSNLLFGVFNFTTTPGDGFFLPNSGEVFAEAIPEPATVLLAGLGFAGVAVVGAIRRRSKR